MVSHWLARVSPLISRVLGGLDGVVPAVPIECARLLSKSSNVTRSTSWFCDRLSLGCVKKSNVVNNKSVSCPEYFSNSNIPQRKLEMVSLVLMLSIKDHEETFRLDEEFETVNLLCKIAIENYKKKYKPKCFRVT